MLLRHASRDNSSRTSHPETKVPGTKLRGAMVLRYNVYIRLLPRTTFPGIIFLGIELPCDNAFKGGESRGDASKDNALIPYRDQRHTR